MFFDKADPKCWERNCKHYIGIKQPDGSERSEVDYCKAFPDGIPRDIAYGDNKHEAVVKGQEGNFIFEKG